MRKLLAALTFAIALAGCSTTQTPDDGASVEDRAPSAQAGAGAGTGGAGSVPPGGAGGAGGAAGTAGTGAAGGVGGVGAMGAGGPGGMQAGAGTGVGAGGPGAAGGRSPLTDPASPLSKRSVFFDYDSFAVKDEFRPLLQAHAKYLMENRAARMRIEGNCDERGTREYNIALGQRRADAVRRVLQGLGAPEMQIETVSFGKEKPRNPGHDEAAWAENRRSDIRYQGE